MSSAEAHHDGMQHRKRLHEGIQARYGDGVVPPNEDYIDRDRDVSIADEEATKRELVKQKRAGYEPQ
jgi:hypothetical protein